MTYKNTGLTELQKLRKENAALYAIVDKVIDFNKKENNKNIKGMLDTLNHQLSSIIYSNHYIILNQYEKLSLDIEAMIDQNFNFNPIIILNRKNRTCYGTYVKGRKDIGIGVGFNPIESISDLKIKCRKYIKEFKK
jgi:hypothetical protein